MFIVGYRRYNCLLARRRLEGNQSFILLLLLIIHKPLLARNQSRVMNASGPGSSVCGDGFCHICRN